jgi:uncharacterized RDD family membrane protein YckC
VESNTGPELRSSRRGAEAAARVAERFAHARSYSEMLAEEPRAEEALLDTQPELERFETVESPTPVEMKQQETGQVLQWDEMHAPTPIWTAPAEHVSEEDTIAIRRDEEVQDEEAPLFAGPKPDSHSGAAEDWIEAHVEAMEAPEPAQPIHANLIEFPREVVATRKIRPRLVEGIYGAVRAAQLSIFEVDPDAISTEVALASAAAAPAWNPAEWSGIELDAEPAAEAVEEENLRPAESPGTPVIEPAAMSRRLLAAVVDATLIGSALIGASALFAANVASLPGPRELAMGVGIGLLVVTGLYLGLFFTLAKATPGMKYACVSLCTFQDERPTRKQRLRRLGTMALSVLPLGLGLLWSLFDEERLCWHDRLSQTYLRSC